MKKSSGKAIILRPFFYFIMPLIVAILVTLFSVHYINSFVRTHNERVAETIAMQIELDVGKVIDTCKQIALFYSTNLDFFRQLNNLVQSKEYTYDQIQRLRTLEKNAEITNSLHSEIASIYFCPGTEPDLPFLISGSGLSTPAHDPDGGFVQLARNNSVKELEFRVYKPGMPMETQYLSYTQHCPDGAGIQTDGTVIVNVDVKTVQAMLEHYVQERTDDLFMVINSDGNILFQSRQLQNVKSTDILSGQLIHNGINYVVIGNRQDNYGFQYCLLATHASLYASSERLIFLNLIVMLIAMSVSIFASILALRRRYNDLRRADDYMNRLDELGSLATKPDEYASAYDDLSNYVKLHLSERGLNERKMELEALRHQLNPHLLMNTLQTLNWRLIREQGGYSDINHTIENLCKILSYSLHPADSLASLNEEKMYTDCYMELWKSRHKTVEIRWELNDDVLDFMVPRLVLQPIVENACKYAFDDKQQSSVIQITCVPSHQTLDIVIRDNGQGITPEKLEILKTTLQQPPPGNQGLGLYITHTRIHLFFGRAFGLEIQSILGEGTCVTVHLPAIRKNPDSSQAESG